MVVGVASELVLTKADRNMNHLPPDTQVCVFLINEI